MYAECRRAHTHSTDQWWDQALPESNAGPKGSFPRPALMEWLHGVPGPSIMGTLIHWGIEIPQ